MVIFILFLYPSLFFHFKTLTQHGLLPISHGTSCIAAAAMLVLHHLARIRIVGASLSLVPFCLQKVS